MECFITDNDDRILLVGEGNFSFSVDFVDYAERNFKKFFSNYEKYQIISTCFEPENKISTIASVNANLLRDKGIQVEFGIDARCLEQYAFLAASDHRHPSFSRVIFNFPHVGGKMRIERNRKLLRDFLVSASQIVQPDGVVCVSLCAGQGGSTVENGVRRWDDSWKAVEAAGEAGMLLTDVVPFPDVLPKYSSTGYRGLQKGFHLNDARVHVFRFATTPLPNPLTTKELDNLLTRTPINTTQYHADKILKNPWQKSLSVQSKFLDKFISLTNLPLKLIDDIVVCDDFYDHDHDEGTILRCLQVNELTDDFSIAPVECVLRLFCVNAFDVAFRTLENLLEVEDFVKFIILRSDRDVMILVDRLLDGDWRKLWANEVMSVSPHKYTLDVTFSVRETLVEQKLIEVLWAVGGDFIVDVKLLSEFVFEEGNKMNYCYRIVYMSYELPLYRARIIRIHNEVVCKAVEYHLNATVV
ncbi:hypothetical protein LSTR_LSTR013862 [Laodelphax striatellus]|uniref:FDX-ACB domain-containing protein n=1 Tax=Laodelphax striatellus TaxID=195883 RepID=A0A482WMJ5_LAOST|nr:hypothetical protein LSTR_LSTR013862 [Laodelphax striatellus]